MAIANLIAQTSVLLIIGLSLWLKKRGSFVWHGNTMLVAVIVPALLVVSHMGPAFVALTKEAIETPNPVSVVGMVHAATGAVAVFLGLWLVTMWSLVWESTGICAQKKGLMLKILVLWLAALGIGIVYYGLHIGFG